jgi:predicted AlkP superfamily phosphohydrolase/phosphomutase
MSKSKIFLIIGIDGMDPEVFSFLHSRGEMPVLGAIADTGNFRRLATSIPPQSPVSWTNISTGTDSGVHGIFDFIHRNPKTYTPELSLFGIQKNKGAVKYISSVQSPSFFERAMKCGIPVTLLRWPLTFPAPESLPSGGRMLPGMGVPDLLGTLGRYSFYTADGSISEKDKHGRIVRITPEDGMVKTEVYGFRYLGLGGMKEASVPMTIEKKSDGIRVTLTDNTLELKTGVWSPHVIIRFSAGLFGRVSAVTRMVCIDSIPFPSLFILPMQINPKDTKLPLSSPSTFGNDLWDEIGPYLTLGMPEDTNGLKDGLITESIFLNLCDMVFAERERMLNVTLNNFDNGIIACVFDTLDRVQHMFWRDRKVTLQTSEKERPTDVVLNWYRRIDTMIGKILQRIGNETPLLILSDHGFTSVDTYVHLNSWLAKNGFMAFKNEAKGSDVLFDNVDWSRTTAYALGFNSIYLNIKGREGKGIVESDKADALCRRLLGELTEWTEDGRSIIKRIYKSSEIYSGSNQITCPDLVVGYDRGFRASKQTVLGGAPEDKLIEENLEHWTGDHCCDPSFVPGVLFGVNLDKAKIDFPRTVSGTDISAMMEGWIENNKR